MDPKRVYQYANPGRLVFGPGAVAELKNELPPNARPLVVTDPGVARAGILSAVTDALAAAGVSYELFDRVQADPPTEVVEEAAAVYRAKKCTAVVAVGGGSSIDVGKAVSVLGTREGTIREYCSGKPIEGALAPVVAVPTTAGTGSEATAVAVISDHARKMKLVLKHPSLVPQVALLDPLLLAGIPPRIAAETGADALTHAIESYLSPASHPLTEALALGAIGMICRHLPRFVADPRDVEAAGQMLLASTMAGQSFKNAGLGLAHSMAHPLGVHFHISHGLACSLYLPSVLEFNASACPGKIAAIAGAAGVDIGGRSPEGAAAAVSDAIRALFRKLGLPITFGEVGVDFQLHPEMLEEALGAIPTKTNPRPADRNQVEALFFAPADPARP
jgi:alcohol dehydrogenase class IV